MTYSRTLLKLLAVCLVVGFVELQALADVIVHLSNGRDVRAESAAAVGTQTVVRHGAWGTIAVPNSMVRSVEAARPAR